VRIFGSAVTVAFGSPETHGLSFMKNGEQLPGPAGSHKVVHLFLRFREFVEPLNVGHDPGK
jgi:hypothetical protein